MKFKTFLDECKRLEVAVDKDIARLNLSDEKLEELGIDLDISQVKDHVRKAVARQKLRTLESLAKIDKAIKKLRREGKPINFGPVSEAAGVSDPTVRKYFGEEVRRFRKLEAKAGAKTGSTLVEGKGEKASDKSKDTMVAAIKKKNAEIKKEDEELREQNKTLLSQVVTLNEKKERLEREVDRLRKRLGVEE